MLVPFGASEIGDVMSSFIQSLQLAFVFCGLQHRPKRHLHMMGLCLHRKFSIAPDKWRLEVGRLLSDWEGNLSATIPPAKSQNLHNERPETTRAHDCFFCFLQGMKCLYPTFFRGFFHKPWKYKWSRVSLNNQSVTFQPEKVSDKNFRGWSPCHWVDPRRPLEMMLEMVIKGPWGSSPGDLLEWREVRQQTALD